MKEFFINYRNKIENLYSATVNRKTENKEVTLRIHKEVNSFRFNDFKDGLFSTELSS